MARKATKKLKVRPKDKKPLTSEKAKKILEDGSVRGRALTAAQKKFFGAVSGGESPGSASRSKRARALKKRKKAFRT